MSVIRKLAIFVILGVPGIVGSGIVYEAFHDSYTAMFIYIVLLLSVAGGFVSK